MNNFIGRSREISLLRRSHPNLCSELIVVYGRRRIGKTALIEHAFSDRSLWKFEGLEGLDQQAQIVAFYERLRHYTGKEYTKGSLSWHAALQDLDNAISESGSNSLVIFFDEFQWLAEMKSSLVSLFKSYWDNNFSKHQGVKVVLCGSISSFMVRNVIRSKALYGRISLEFNITGLTAPEVYEFFGGKLSAREVLDVMMTLGGVPNYLEEYDPSLSLVQNLHENVLSRSGFFFKEFRRLFISHFGETPIYERIVRALAKRSLGAAELARSCGTQTGGTFTKKLEELTLAGFVERYTPLKRDGKSSKARQVRYRIADEYIALYFALLEPNLTEIESGSLQGFELLRHTNYATWQGHAFERFVRKNNRLIADFLRFSGISYGAGSWFSLRDSELAGVQVDLMFLRKDKVITMCEVKAGSTLNSNRIADALVRKEQALSKYFPGYAVQRVLVVREEHRENAGLKRICDRVLVGEDLLLAG